MERALRALSERIRFIEGFEVEISTKNGLSLQRELGHYEFPRAASRKWTIDYWEEKRNRWDFLEFNVRGADGKILSKRTPLDVPRGFYQRRFGIGGDKLQVKIECKTDQVAMQLRRELLNIGIDAGYRLEKFLFFKSHFLEWISPNLRMNVFERCGFEKTLKEHVQKLDSEVEFRYTAGDRHGYLDECPDGYHYISSVDDLSPLEPEAKGIKGI